MSFVTLDYETAFRSRKDKGTPGPAYSLKSLTYEQYLRGEWYTKTHGHQKVPFRTHGVGVKIDRAPTEWVSHNDLEYFQKEMFPEGNDHTILCHNTLFDGAILNWVYGLKAAKYYDTQGMSRALWNQQPATLKGLAERCFPNDPNMRKGDELEVADGIWYLDAEQEKLIAGYCIQDVELTFACFEKMWQMGFPPEELEVMDMTLKMFIDRPFLLDKERVEKYQRRLNRNKERWYRISGWPRSTLASNDKFVARLEKDHGIKIEKIPSPTDKNPDNMRYPLAKDDLEFLEIQDKHPELKAIWKARLAATANSELSRCARVLDHGSVSHINPNGNIAMPLNYHKAHTGRWGGTNKQNPQNLGRGSILRRGLKAPEGSVVVVRDLSNIEGRMSAWFCGQQDMLDIIASGQDIYNDMATAIYGYPVNRKDPKYTTEGFVGKVASLGLGYGMGANKFHHTLASGAMGKRVNIGIEKATHVVQTYRRKNFAISQMWKNLQFVIQDMANEHIVPYMLGPVRIEYRRVVLPNGLALNYPGLRAIDHPEAFNEYEYWEGKFWKKIYGGLFLENCISGSAEVLTPAGWIRLDHYEKGMEVWDGEEFVRGGDLLNKGKQKTIKLNGVKLTPDHKVLTDDETWKEASQLQGFDLKKVRLPDCNKLRRFNREEKPVGMSMCLRGETHLRKFRTNKKTRDTEQELRLQDKRGDKRTKQNTRNEQTPRIRSMALNERPLSATYAPSMAQLWRAGDRRLRSLAEKFRELLGRYGGDIPARARIRSNRQQWGLSTRQLPMGNIKTKLQQQKKFRGDRYASRPHEFNRSSGIFRHQPNDTPLQNQQRMSDRKAIRETGLYEQVYDIANCGPRHRFVVRAPGHEPFIAHNCIQALSRIIMSSAMVRFNRWLGDKGQMALTVHDEVVVIAKEEHADAAFKRLDIELTRTPEWADERLVLESDGGIDTCYSK